MSDPGRSIPNESERFKKTTTSKAGEANALLVFRREPMERAWNALDEGWKDLQEKMIEAGIVDQPASLEGLVGLNLGGSIVNICRSVLLESGNSEKSDALLWNIVSRVWDKRLPRDNDGNIVIDESTVCMKHIIRMLLNESSTAKGTAALPFGDDLSTNEMAYMPHTGLVFGIGMAVIGDSHMLQPHDRATATLRKWCPGKPARMELLYRASRDGWTGQAFHSRCGDDSPSTITLFRVTNNNSTNSVVGGLSSVSWSILVTNNNSTNSVVGGFSSVSWSTISTNMSNNHGGLKSSPGAFVFMLTDGVGIESTAFRPTKWGIREGRTGQEVVCGRDCWPVFNGLSMHMSNRNMMVSSTGYDIPFGSPFLQLDGRPVIDMEVFRVCATRTAGAPPSPPANAQPDTSIFNDGVLDLPDADATAVSSENYDGDIRSFGVSIADSLMEERIALHQAHDELADTKAKAKAAGSALVALYGPHVAANEEGVAAVVELNVRGTRMTTLLSTLQACPDSAFAARFDEDKWPPSEKDIDEHGRRVIDDCSPSVFSKVLDVLRVRKRMAWGSNAGDGESDVRVVVKAVDREAFEEFVHMYFTDQESFIMDLVQHPCEVREGST